jgi:hypothetical protein
MRQVLLFLNGGTALVAGGLLMAGGARMDQDLALFLLVFGGLAVLNFAHLMRAAPNPALNWRPFKLFRLWLDKKERELSPPPSA